MKNAKNKKKEIPTKTLVVYLVISLTLIAGLGVLGSRGTTTATQSWADAELRQIIVDTCDVPEDLSINTYAVLERHWDMDDVNTLYTHLDVNSNIDATSINHEANEGYDIYFANNGSAITVSENMSLVYERSANTAMYLIGMTFSDNVLYMDRHSPQEIPDLQSHSLDDALKDIDEVIAALGISCDTPSTVRYMSKSNLITSIKGLEQIDNSIEMDYELCDEFYFITIPTLFENVALSEYTEYLDSTDWQHKGQGLSVIYTNEGIEYLGIEGAIEDATVKDANVKYASVSECLDWLIDIMDSFLEADRVEIGDVRFEYTIVRSDRYEETKMSEMVPTWTFYDRGMNVIARFNAADGLRLM